MGNRAVIATSKDEKSVGIYLHWNGGLESILAFLEVAKRRGYRDVVCDSSYGMARLTGIIHEFFDGGLSLGIGTLDHLDVDNFDNGAYLIGKDWEIIDRWGEGSTEKTDIHDLSKEESEIFLGIAEQLMEGHDER